MNPWIDSKEAVSSQDTVKFSFQDKSQCSINKMTLGTKRI